MRCPFCAHDDTQVKDSRPTEDNASIRRRRQCSSCGARFTTFERVQLREVVVVKSGLNGEDGRREPFERSKLEHSVALACRKRGIDQERLDQLSTFDNVLVALYDHFLRERFGKGWPTRRQQITDWINSRTAARAA